MKKKLVRTLIYNSLPFSVGESCVCDGKITSIIKLLISWLPGNHNGHLNLSNLGLFLILFKLLAEFSSCHIEWRFLFSWWMLTEGLSASRDCLKFSFTQPYPQPGEKCSSVVSLALHFMFMINFCVKGSFD